MTVIVASRSLGIMASDTLTSDPKTKTKCGHVVKIVKGPDGALAGAAGDGAACSDFLEWVQEGRSYDVVGRWFRKGIEGLLLLPDRRILYYATTRPDEIIDDYAAIGAGAPHALACMFLGASPVDAVRAACHVCTECGGDPQVLEL